MTEPTNPEGAEPTITPEPAEVEAEETDQSLLGAEPAEAEPTEEEQDDIEVDGKKFALPKSAAEKLKAERMMHGDYTRKTQEVAEQRRAVEAQAEQVQKQRQESQQYIAEVAKVVSIDEQLAAYQSLDWQAIIDQDPVAALKHQQQMRVLEGKRTQALQALAQKQQQHALNEQQAIAKQAQEAEAYFAREIPNWSPARSDALMKYGVSQGLPAQTITQVVLKTPALATVLHKAELYDQMAKKQPPEKPAPPPAKPVAKVGQNANVRKEPANMTDAEFAAYRRKVQTNRKK